MPMPKSAKLEQQLADLNDLADQNCTPELIAALSHRSNLILAKAAQIAAHNRCHEVIPQLVVAFEHLCSGDPVKLDKGCWGKTAIIKALFELDFEEEAFYRPILKYRQIEPAWGESEDTAAEVRATAVLGLAASNPRRMVIDLIDLLQDSESQVRLAAAQAIGSLSSDASEAVLRQKALSGDKSPEVIGECFSALLEMAPRESPEFVARFLKGRRDAVPEFAALALGESKIPEAIQELEKHWKECRLSPDSREMVIRALSLARTEQAFNVLFQILTEEENAVRQVVRALAIYRHDERIRSDIEMRVKNVGDVDLLELWKVEWED
jgi:HEAT repeat protein